MEIIFRRVPALQQAAIHRFGQEQGMRLRYTPFGEKFAAEIQPNDLVGLKTASEGWYIEYKSEPISPKAIAKSLAAFANQYGGWLIFGVLEDKSTLCAKEFPGVLQAEIPALIAAVRNAVKDIIKPELFYEYRVFDGPIVDIGLPAGRAVLVVCIPPGPETPYVHNDGRVYLRVADASDPRWEADRSTLDRLWERAEVSRSRLEKFVTKTPEISEGESGNTYLHMSILSDPFEIQRHWYGDGFSSFVELMKQNPVPFDNFSTSADGFVARQVGTNPFGSRVVTWEFHLRCHSFITLPINIYHRPYPALEHYRWGGPFVDLLESRRIEQDVLDLNVAHQAIRAFIERHRALVSAAKINGPFYVKLRLENVWRRIPFLDVEGFVAHCRGLGVPISQYGDVLVPPRMELKSFILLPERGFKDIVEQDSYEDALLVFAFLLQALGVPAEFIDSHEKDLFSTATRFSEMQVASAKVQSGK